MIRKPPRSPIRVPAGRTTKLDFSRPGNARSLLDRLGATYSGGSNALEFVGGKWRTPNSSYPRTFAFPEHHPGMHIAPARENRCLRSNDIANWVSGLVTLTEAESIIDDSSSAAREVNGDGTDYCWVGAGTASGNEEVIQGIVEYKDSDVCDFLWRDTTDPTNLIQVRFTFSTETVSIEGGTAITTRKIKLADSGPNGGAVWWFGALVSTVGHSGHVSRLQFWPNKTGAGFLSTILHYGDIGEVTETNFGTPIITAAATVTQTAENLSFGFPSTSDWNGLDHTILVDYTGLGGTPDTPYFTVITDAGANDTTECALFTGVSTLTRAQYNGNPINGLVAGDHRTGRHKIAVSADASNVGGALDGSTTTGAVGGAAKVDAPVLVQIGNAGIDETYTDGYLIHSIEILNEALSASQLAALTS